MNPMLEIAALIYAASNVGMLTAIYYKLGRIERAVETHEREIRAIWSRLNLKEA